MIGSEGQFVDSFGRKFEAGFEGWKPGQFVNSKFIVQKRGEDLELLVANSVVGDIRHADIFELPSLSDDAKQQLLRVGVAEIDVDIEVVGNMRYEVSNMYRYEAKINRINSIQPAFNGNYEELVLGQQVLVEGRVTDYRRAEGQGVSDYGHCKVELPDSTVVDVTMWNGYLTYEDGALGVIDPPHPTEGDKVQINCTYGNPGARYMKDDGLSLFAYYTRSTFMLEPSQERAELYASRRKLVDEAMQAFLDTQDLAEARRILAQVIKGTLITGGTSVKGGLTAGEQDFIRNAVELKFTDPDEKPLDLFGDEYEAEEINKVWGVDVYSMSRADFYRFCMSFANGEIAYVRTGGIDSPYRFFDKALSRGQQIEVLSTAVRYFSSNVIGKRIVSTRGKPGEQDRDPGRITDPDFADWDTGYLFEQSMSYLSHYPEKDVADIFIDLISQMDSQNRFLTAVDRDENRDYYETGIFRCATQNLESALLIQDGEVVGVGNREVVARYKKQLPLMRSLSEKMHKNAWNNEGRYRLWEYVDRFATSIEKAADFAYTSNYPNN